MSITIVFPAPHGRHALLSAEWLREQVLAEIAHRHVVLTIPSSACSLSTWAILAWLASTLAPVSASPPWMARGLEVARGEVDLGGHDLPLVVADPLHPDLEAGDQGRGGGLLLDQAQASLPGPDVGVLGQQDDEVALLGLQGQAGAGASGESPCRVSYSMIVPFRQPWRVSTVAQRRNSPGVAPRGRGRAKSAHLTRS